MRSLDIYIQLQIQCSLRLSVPSSTRRQFDIAFVENWRRYGYSERFRCHKYICSANVTTGKGYSVERVETIFRPVHMTPSWNEKDVITTMYLNSKTDVHAWMNFY